MSTTKRSWCSPGSVLRSVAVVAVAATSLVWIDTGGHVEAADLIPRSSFRPMPVLGRAVRAISR